MASSPGPQSRLSGALRGATIALASMTWFASFAQAQENLTAAGPSDSPIFVREHAGWNRNCEGVPHPQMWLDEAPRHGTVCVRTETIKIASMFYGTQAQCIGREVSGLRLIYLPRPGYVGADAVRYAVQYPSLRRTVSVAVTVTAGHANGQGAPGVVVPVLETRQPAGPLPACVDEAS